MALPRDDPERPPRRLPRIPQRSIRTQKEAEPGVPLHGDAGHSVGYQVRSEKGQASGYAGLDVDGLVAPAINRGQAVGESVTFRITGRIRSTIRSFPSIVFAAGSVTLRWIAKSRSFVE